MDGIRDYPGKSRRNDPSAKVHHAIRDDSWITSRIENSLRLASVIQCAIAEALTDADYSPKVLVLYLERPATQ